MSKMAYLKRSHNWVTHGVTGDFELALVNLIQDLKSENKPVWKILDDWDNIRGNDWFTQTRKNLTEVDLDTEDGWADYLEIAGVSDGAN